MKHEEIAKVFGVGGYSAVSSVIGRIQIELEKGGKIVRRYQQIQGLLQKLAKSRLGSLYESVGSRRKGIKEIYF